MRVRTMLAAATVLVTAVGASVPARAQTFLDTLKGLGERVSTESLAAAGGFRLTGSIDEDAVVDTLRIGTRTFRTIGWGTRYAPAVEGFVLDPRLLTFTYAGSFTDHDTRSTDGDTRTLSVEPYQFSTTLLPFGLHSLTLGAGRSTTDLDLEHGSVSTTTDTMRAAYTFRGGTYVPETTVGIERFAVDERRVDGTRQGLARTTYGLRLRKDVDRFRPTFSYALEDTTFVGVVSPLQAPGLRHRLRLDDRIRVGEQAVLTPVLEYALDDGGADGAGAVTLSGPLSPTMDGSVGARYALFERSSEAAPIRTSTASTQSQLTKRFSEDLVLTAVASAVYVTAGAAGDSWSLGGVAALRAAPLPHLRGVVDYGLTMSEAGSAVLPTVTHRAHVNATSSYVPRHTFTGDYFVTTTDIPDGPLFTAHSAVLSGVSEVIPRTTLSAVVAADLQDGNGHRERQAARLGGEVRVLPSLTTRAGVDYIAEDQTGGGRAPQRERALVGDAGVSLRLFDWVDVLATGRYGVKDVVREDRVGQFPVSGVTVRTTLLRGPARGQIEAFDERDDAARQRRVGVRGTVSYRFRAWTIVLDAELSDARIQDIDSARQRVLVRITRPLDFTWP